MLLRRIEALSSGLAESLARIHAAAFAEEGARGWSAQELRDLCARPSARLWAAFDAEEKPLAFLLCDQVLDEAEILTFATAPEARRRGAARALLALARADLRREGAILLRLEVATDNLPALTLYQSVGFKEIAVRKAYFARAAGGVDARILDLGL